MREFLREVLENLAFLTKKGTWVSVILSFGLTACFYHFVMKSPELSVSLVLTLCFFGMFFFELPIYLLGYLIWKNNWPAMDFENFWDQVGWNGTKTKPQIQNENEDAPAVQEAMRIMQASRDEVLARERKSDNK